MESRANKTIENYIIKFKDDIKSKIIEMNFAEKEKTAELLGYIYDYERLCFTKEDFSKRKRIKNSIPSTNRCLAKRASGEQCTRRKRDDCEYCGTHSKGTPHGTIINGETPENVMHKLDVVVEHIRGIPYYIDRFCNVYNTEDIQSGADNPRIITKAVKVGDTYTLPDVF
jgi:hypothetical protein